MRLVGFVGVSMLAAFVGVARADEKPINLLTAVPTTIAVSSTVDNTSIKPEHIADGKLDTAWNSRTGELTPHVMIRLPAQSKVTSIKLTAGFTKIDKKLGDLFTMNPRIKKVRVKSGAKTAEFPLDITKRELQELKIDLPGGDIDIEVLASEPGSKKTWREISISEIEVWGTTTLPGSKQKPAIRLHSLDALPVLSRAECAKAVGKVSGKVSSTDEIAVSKDLTVCRIDAAQGEGRTHVTLAAVSRGAKKVLGTPLEIDLENRESKFSGDPNDTGSSGVVEAELFELRTTEQGLQITEKTGSSTMYSSDSTEKITLYRVDASGFGELATWTTKNEGSMESNRGTDCTLLPFTPSSAMPKKLKVECVEWYDDYHNEDPSERGRHETKSSTTYVWDGTSYKEK